MKGRETNVVVTCPHCHRLDYWDRSEERHRCPGCAHYSDREKGACDCRRCQHAPHPPGPEEVRDGLAQRLPSWPQRCGLYYDLERKLYAGPGLTLERKSHRLWRLERESDGRLVRLLFGRDEEALAAQLKDALGGSEP